MNSKAKNWQINRNLCQGGPVGTQLTVLGYLLEEDLFILGDFGHQGKGAGEELRWGSLWKAGSIPLKRT
jgi:hypothetical protein